MMKYKLALVLLMSLLFTVFLVRPSIFPGHGFTGPDEWRLNTPEGIRFTGDSYRYIGGAEQIIEGQNLDAMQVQYRGYICIAAALFACGLGLKGLIALQFIASLVTLLCVMWLAQRIGGKICAILAGAILALNADFAVWTTFVMTECIYSCAVAIIACLLVMTAEKRKWWHYASTAVLALFFAFLRPTGWILLPAVGCCFVWSASWKLKWRLAAMAGVWAIFVIAAFGMSNSGSGISSQSPVAKLYSGEVIWQEDLWRADMPEPPEDKESYVSASWYIVRHPIACTKLALKRVLFMFVKVRPGYTKSHNLLLIAIYSFLGIAGLAGLVLAAGTRGGEALIALTVAHALVVALTFNDNDGRFVLYIVPLLSVASSFALFLLGKLCVKCYSDIK